MLSRPTQTSGVAIRTKETPDQPSSVTYLSILTSLTSAWSLFWGLLAHRTALIPGSEIVPSLPAIERHGRRQISFHGGRSPSGRSQPTPFNIVVSREARRKPNVSASSGYSHRPTDAW